MTMILEFDHVAKVYDAGRSRPTLRSALRPRRRSRPTDELVCALRDVSFSVEAGESVGLIGDNGAGKSTLLRLASRVTAPTAGRIAVTSDTAGLVDLSGGLHPELTGRENIALQAQLLGQRGRRLLGQESAIEEFSGVGEALDRPVKYYSSGMRLRLMFAIGAHIDPALLLIDEALAVGDVEFQRRCRDHLARFRERGGAMLLVSHDMQSIEALCDRALWLDDGVIRRSGLAGDVIAEYLGERAPDEPDIPARVIYPDGEELRLESLDVVVDGATVASVAYRSPMSLRLTFSGLGGVAVPTMSVGIEDDEFGCFLVASQLVDGGAVDPVSGTFTASCHFPDGLPVQPRRYRVYVAVADQTGVRDLFSWRYVGDLEIHGDPGSGVHAVTRSLTDAPVRVRHSWTVA